MAQPFHGLGRGDTNQNQLKEESAIAYHQNDYIAQAKSIIEYAVSSCTYIP